MAYRIAVGSIFTECNHFSAGAMEFGDFAKTELRRGQDVLACEVGTVGGMLGRLRQHGVEVAPLLVASAYPGPALSRNCYERLKGELLDDLRRALPVDGVLLALHGSAAVHEVGDLEGDLLTAVRQIVPRPTPLVATLDLHAHVSEAMVEHSDALLAWETYPHRDAVETGQRGAKMLVDILEGRIRPTMVMAKVPVIVGAIHGSTEGDDPFADVMRSAKAAEGQGAIASTAAFLVHPNLDLPGMGGGCLAIADNNYPEAEAVATRIAMEYWSRRLDLEPTALAPGAAIAEGLRIPGQPVLLLEAADCVGGGAAGDSIATLRALVDAQLDVLSIAPVVDPVAASTCHLAGAGAMVTVELGHALDTRWGRPARFTGTVESLRDGAFVYTGGIWGGQPASMGPTAVLRIGKVRALVMSRATYDWRDEQIRAAGLDPSHAKFIVVKNPMNYRVAYAGLSAGGLVLDTPGPTPPTMKHTVFANIARPYFPADSDIPGLQPTILRRRTA